MFWMLLKIWEMIMYYLILQIYNYKKHLKPCQENCQTSTAPWLCTDLAWIRCEHLDTHISNQQPQLPFLWFALVRIKDKAHQPYFMTERLSTWKLPYASNLSVTQLCSQLLWLKTHTALAGLQLTCEYYYSSIKILFIVLLLQYFEIRFGGWRNSSFHKEFVV